jgi:serine/threonine protein kinase
MIGTILNSRYHIIRKLGQGGFGATFIAADRWQNNQHCAIKQLKPDALSPETLYLFEKEAEFLFKLGSHPQIPQLLAHFQEERVFYIVQELIEGNDLTQEIKRGQRLGETQVIKLLIEILEVLEYVHQNQVIHRDIKPANIIRRRDGKIVLIDFGGIKQVRARSANSTLLTAIIGTPGYMPIEQFNNNAHFCSDIHAVGMMGIFALTGIDPDPRIGGFPKRPQAETLWRDKAQVSQQLADVIDKMVKFDYRQRYQSATAVLAALKCLFLPHNWLCVRTLQEHYLPHDAFPFSPDGQILASGSGDKTIKLWQMSTGRKISTLKGHSDGVASVAFSPDGQILASCSSDETIKIWQVSTGREIRTFKGHSKWVFSVAFSPDEQIIASCSSDATIKIWQVSTGREIRTLKGHSDVVMSVAFSPDEQIIASGSSDNTIKIWQRQ